MVDRTPVDEMFQAVFSAAADAMLVTDDDRRYVAANPAACRLLQRSLDELLQLRVEDVTPVGVDVDGAWRSFTERGEAAGEYVIERPDGSPVDVDFRATANVTPGRHLSILRDVSERRRAERERDDAHARLREAYDRVNHIALTLQEAMLPSPGTTAGLDVATRYHPATDALAIGGDWYDLIDLGMQRVALTVGDVMGHGLAAAGSMGQLRSALAAALLAVHEPGPALGVLDEYARTASQPLMATAFAALLDVKERQLTYSSAGHLPPLLVMAPSRQTRFLDEIATPPIAAAPALERRPQTTVTLPADVTIILYTDGLVERRGEDIGDGLRRLADAAAGVAHEDCESLVDDLLHEVRATEGGTDDDVAVVVAKL